MASQGLAGSTSQATSGLGGEAWGGGLFLDFLLLEALASAKSLCEPDVDVNGNQ